MFKHLNSCHLVEGVETRLIIGLGVKNKYCLGHFFQMGITVAFILT